MSFKLMTVENQSWYFGNDLYKLSHLSDEEAELQQPSELSKVTWQWSPPWSLGSLSNNAVPTTNAERLSRPQQSSFQT